MTPTASVIVLAYGNRAATERCLETIADALGDRLGSTYELVLVDNDSPDDTAELFAAWSDRALVVTLPENRNFAGGCNAGAAASSGDVLLFLNNDTEVPAGALEAVAEQALEPGVGAAGARLLYPDGTIQHAGVVHRETQPGKLVPFHLFQHQPGDLPQACAVFDVDAVTGACLAVPRDLFQELGGFDEAYVNGLEDVDLCLRIRTAGRRVVYRGDVDLIHHERLTRGADHAEIDNLDVFSRRWGTVLEDDGPLLERLFDVRFGIPQERSYGGSMFGGVAVAVEGRLRSIAPEAVEARALIAALEAAGLTPAARDWEPTWELSRAVESPEWAAVSLAERRVAGPSPLTVQVRGGELSSLRPGDAAVARLGALPRGNAALATDAVWAASPALADALVAGGFPETGVAWLPPAISRAEPSPGGEGILALLPTHDPASCQAIVEALAPLRGVRARLLPTVSSGLLRALAEERLPDAELLAPISDERRFEDLASACDVVLGLDGDHFERRALVAAGKGAAVVSPAGGPAAGVLGEGTAVAGFDEVEPVTAAVERALEDAGARTSRSALVRGTCGPEGLAERLRALVEDAERIRSAASALRPAAERALA